MRENNNMLEILKSNSERVFKILGFGLSEKAYQKALALECLGDFLQVEEEYVCIQHYTNKHGVKKQVAALRADIFLDRRYIIELKQSSNKLKLDGKEVEQAKRYKRITGAIEAVLVNFHKTGVQFIVVDLRKDGAGEKDNN